MEVLNSLTHLLKQSSPALLLLMAVIVGIITLMYTWYSYRYRRLKLDLVQKILDAGLAKIEYELGVPIRASIMIIDGNKLEPIIVRPRGSELKADSPLTSEMVQVGRLTTERQMPTFYSSSLKEGDSSDSEITAIRGILSVPLIGKDGKVIGVITLYSTRPFTELSQEALIESAEQIAREAGPFLSS